MALRLTRHRGQTVVLTTEQGERIVLTVDTDPGRGAFAVSVDAPASVKILRGELELAGQPAAA
jgi:sRNA-binding carbon storage regulator CsrA